MAATVDILPHCGRDLRGAHKEWKRERDSTSKWAHGARPMRGFTFNWQDMEPLTRAEASQVKCRPRPKRSEQWGHPITKDFSNVVKASRYHYGYTDHPRRIRNKAHAKEEIDDTSRSLADLVIPATREGSMHDTSADVLYNFDRSDSPGRPVALDIFVKEGNTNRATERLVEKEYEILDTNGEALKGRKARRDLRKSASNPNVDLKAAADAEHDEDGFELV